MLTTACRIARVICACIAVITVHRCSSNTIHVNTLLSARADIAVRAVAVIIALTARYRRVQTSRTRITCVIRAAISVITAYGRAWLARTASACIV